MIKKISILMVMFVFCFLLTGCGSKTKIKISENNSINKTVKTNYTFENLKSDLSKLDSSIQVIQKAANYVGAEEGYGYVMSNCSIEVYRFNKSSEEYKKAEAEQKLSMPSVNMSFDATVKNGYGYLITEGTCDEALKYVDKLY